MSRVAQLTQLHQFQVSDAADAMTCLRQLFEQQGLGDILLAKQALVALGLDGREGAVTRLSNPQGRDRNAGEFGHGTNAIQRGVGRWDV
jgi:hypothetical protein